MIEKVKIKFKSLYYYFLLNTYGKYIPYSFLKNDTQKIKSIDFFIYIFLLKSYWGALKVLQKENFAVKTLYQERQVKKVVKQAFLTSWWTSYFKENNFTNKTNISNLPPVHRFTFIDIPKKDLLTTSEDSPILIWRSSGGSTTGIPFWWALNKSVLIINGLSSCLQQLEKRGFSFEKNQKNKFHIHFNIHIPTYRHPFKWFSAEDITIFQTDPDFEEKIKFFYKRIMEAGDAIILTSPIQLLFLVNIFKERNLHPPIKFVMTVGSALGEELRDEAIIYFKCDVFAFYGAQEMGLCAIECTETIGRYHIMEDRVLVEILDENNSTQPDGTEGLVTVTCLDNTVMPLIRYQPGDVAILHKNTYCNCGNQFNYLELKNRTTDRILLENGKKIPVMPLLKILSTQTYTSYLTKFQIQQVSTSEIIIKLESSKNFSEAIFNILRDEVYKYIDNKIAVTFVILKEIPQEGPKFKLFVPCKA